RRVLAYDLAIGAGDSVDDVVFYQYLCRVADWRLDWEAAEKGANGQIDVEVDLPSEEVEQLYWAEEDVNRSLIDATVAYRNSGAFPEAVKSSLPSLVATQTIDDRYFERPVRLGGAV
ncbi:TPA: effector protein Tle3 domain-containing protein, partial [Pseudomonas aeruginosa]